MKPEQLPYRCDQIARFLLAEQLTDQGDGLALSGAARVNIRGASAQDYGSQRQPNPRYAVMSLQSGLNVGCPAKTQPQARSSLPFDLAVRLGGS